MNSKIFKPLLISALFLLICVKPVLSFSQEKEAAGNEKPFDPKEVVFEHIGDSHSWPVAVPLLDEHFIPLPIILYTDKGMEFFSSEQLGHHHKEGHEAPVYKGAHYSYKLEGNKIVAVNEAGEINKDVKIYDFSITRNVISMWMGMIILLLVFFTVSSAYKKRAGKAPKGLQSLLEPVVLFVRDDVAIPNIGVKYARYMPLLLTIFFFILINNLLGLVPFFPGGFNLTGNIAVTLTLSVIVLIVVNLSGNKYYWKHIFTPDIPLWLYPIMLPVELIGIISKPFALMIRLFANITAGHIIVLSLISLIFIFKTAWMSAVSVPFVVFMDCIELLVAFLQAFIFTMLTSLFIGMAVEEHHH
ncbi:F0F1 ATP synthase subunit A [Mucilaginibacter pocheonensis]|uniref:ATP synthase subunit a n=1 Tax=Mucilaginibacter pocheonensis TaxID=398050 RepID=A0ABU1TBF7_9SPHI|nr:F0F1 ATP synthase subunit A [Mucilaginibacter pocheonensis]MDR6942619.1 F-type H+-transporting ATPase subunit a [Mucilaginibacter pocheonensis]